MSELNAMQIVEDLERCVEGDCYPCTYGKIGAGCRDKMCADAVALIKELTEENEKWRNLIVEQNEYTAEANKNLKDIYNGVKNLVEENERLKAEEKQSQILIKTLHDKLDEGYAKFVDEERANTAREIFEEIDAIREKTTRGDIMRLTFFKQIDKLKKKYTEKKK